MTNDQIIKELDFIQKKFPELSESERRSVWANLSQICESMAIKIAKQSVKKA